MSGHLCLKWNNHAAAFLKYISHIQIKEKYCDATIVCQGKYFPVHRVILSTCSDYFDDIFERMQCQHPYIVFKDIEPREMELLLNYMYQGEVNVVQEMLPTLIKAAEALRIKGLAVPDDLPSGKESTAKKRISSSSDNPLPKRWSDEGRRRRRGSCELNPQIQTSETEKAINAFHDEVQNNEQPKLIKEEPPDIDNYSVASLPPPEFNDGTIAGEEAADSRSKEPGDFISFPMADDDPSSYIKNESNLDPDQPLDEQSPSWSDYACGSTIPNLPPSEIAGSEDALERNERAAFSMNFENLSAVFEEREGNKISETKYAQKCPFCPYQSSNTKNIERHTRFKHTGDRPFPCVICSKRFVAKTDLQRHILTHTGEKPYRCSHCLIKFRSRYNLRLHLTKKSQCRERQMAS